MVCNVIKKAIIGKEPDSKNNFIWNMLGSLIYAMSTILMSYLTIRIIGEDMGGVFAIALTIAQMLVYIGYFEMRTYQVTDAKNEYTFGQYFTTKICTCTLMFIVSVAYVLIKGYSSEKAFIVLLVCILKLVDAFADVYESQFHKDGYLNIAGKSLAYRTILMLIVYFSLLLLTENLVFTLAIVDIVAVVGVIIFDVWIYTDFGKTHLEKKIVTVVNILKDCFPLFLGVFLWTYILSASRLAVDSYMDNSYQAYYQAIFLPVSVINLFAGFLFRPMLTTLTEMYANRKNKEFFKIIFKMIALLFIITVICLIGAFICGIPILSIATGCDLAEYKELLLFTIFAGGINAIAFVLYYVLTIYREKMYILVGYGLSALLALYISPLMVKENGLWGASISYLITVLFMMCTFVVAIVLSLYKNNYRKEDN